MRRVLVAAFALSAAAAIAVALPSLASVRPGGPIIPTSLPSPTPSPASLAGARVKYICAPTYALYSPGGNPIIFFGMGVETGQKWVVRAGPVAGAGSQWIQVDMGLLHIPASPGSPAVNRDILGWLNLKCVTVVQPAIAPAAKQ